MRVLAKIRQKWLREVGPRLIAAEARLLYGSLNVHIGERLRADGLPRIVVDDTASVHIGADVELRAGVEIRAHGTSRIIIEDGVRIDRGVRILSANASTVRIGSGTRIGMYSVFGGGDCIDVGTRVLISGFVFLQTSQHRFELEHVPIRDQGYEHAPVRVEDGAWLAAHVVVMPGVTVGRNAIVGSNGVVTKDVPARAVVVGVPSRPLASRQA